MNKGMKKRTPSNCQRLASFALSAASLSFLSLSACADVTFLGVASGDASSTDAVVWTRAVDTNAPAATDLIAQVAANDPSVTIGVVSFPVTTDPARDYTAKVVASNLLPGTKYYYRFVNAANAANASITGTFKTAPDAAAAASLRFAFSGDCDGLMRPYALASLFPSQNLDFFVFLGDTIYENASAGSPSVTLSGTIPAPSTNGATRAQLFNDYSKKYREQFLPVNPGGQKCLQPLFAAQGNYTLLDNHELGNRQYINGGAPAGGPVGDMPSGAGVDARTNINDVNTGPDFMNKALGFETLQQVYLNYQPVRERGFIATGMDARTDGTPLLFFAQRWGQNAIFINADDRTYRDIRMKTAANADDTGVRAANANRTMLGATQLGWLKQTLLDAEAAGVPWKIIAISSPIDQLGPIGGALAGVTNGGNTGYVPVASDGGKSWMGQYRVERNALLKFIADHHIYNVVFLSTDDHQNRINELTYSPTGLTEDQSSYVRVPHCLEIVDGPLGATGPELVTNHTFANNKLIADSIAAAQTAAGIDPIGLDPSYPGLHNVTRENDPMADSVRQPVDFYSPDTFNFNTLNVTPDGTTLTVIAVGINSYAVNSRPEYDPINNPARSIFSFQIDAFADPAFTACPGDITLNNDPGHCSASLAFSVAATGRPAPAITCTLGGVPITSPFTFPVGSSAVICIASNAAAMATCNFTVTVLDREAPVVACSPVSNPGGKNGGNQSGSNANEFFQLLSQDNCDPNPQIFVHDSASALVAGPFANGDIVQITQNTSAATVQRQTGGAVVAHIILKGTALLVASDAQGNASTPQAGCPAR